MKAHRISIIAALLFAVPVSGQMVRFVAFDLQVAAGTSQLVSAEKDGGSISVELGVSRFSDPVKVPPGSYKLVLPDGKTNGNLLIGEDTERKILAIVLPGAEGTVNVITAPDEPTKFGGGDRLFINATNSEIRMQIGERNLVCKSGTTQIVKPPQMNSEGRVPVRMAVTKDGNWIIFNSTWWPVDKVSRSLILLHPDMKTGVPRVRTIEEIPREP